MILNTFYFQYRIFFVINRKKQIDQGNAKLEKIFQEKEKLQEENFFINYKYQELKTKHSETLKQYRILEEKYEEMKSQFNKEESKDEGGDSLVNSMMDNYKVNENFDFSPYNYSYKRTKTTNKTKFASEKNKLLQMKTVSALNFSDSTKDNYHEEEEENVSKKESNADLNDKDSFSNNASLSIMTNSDILKTKLEITEKFNDHKIENNLVREKEKNEQLLNKNSQNNQQEIFEPLSFISLFSKLKFFFRYNSIL